LSPQTSPASTTNNVAALPAVGFAAALAVLYLAIDPPSADLAAHLYRAGLVHRAGLVLWDNNWYAGHNLPSYSLLFPWLASLIGVRLLGALSAVAATAAFGRLATGAFGPRAGRLAALWFALTMTAAVVSGRLPFVFGTALGTAALLAAVHRRTALAAVLGAATALGSPVAALFVALVAAAWVLARRPGHTPPAAAWALGATAAGVTLAVAVMFPEGGTEPFAASSFWPALAATLLALAIAKDGPPQLKAGFVLYGLLLVTAYAVPTPLGGNAARLGALLGGPLAVALLWPRRPWVLAMVAVPLVYWMAYPAVRDWARAAEDPSLHASYYAPLLSELARRDIGQPPARVEIPFTAGHWESYRVAQHVPLARGWERQLDRRDNPLFYQGPLTDARYRVWLRSHAVRWVALPDAKLDHSAQAEAVLISAEPSYLREVWGSAHWRLFEVRHTKPLGARHLGVDSFTADSGLVRVRWTRHWAVVGGHGCIAPGPGGWTDVSTSATGATLRVAMSRDPLRALVGGRRCR
jgi:hypothetical protein